MSHDYRRPSQAFTAAYPSPFLEMQYELLHQQFLNSIEGLPHGVQKMLTHNSDTVHAAGRIAAHTFDCALDTAERMADNKNIVARTAGVVAVAGLALMTHQKIRF